ncbi:MAG: Rid family detoxifying hydrolase [Mariprofundaceae bacterium]
MNTIHPICSSEAPEAVGAYSQAVTDGHYVYLSGQIGLMPESGNMAGDDIEEQSGQIISNLNAVLHAAGCSRQDILKVTIFLVDMKDFPVVNAIYADWLGEHRPARATVGVAALPLDAKIEMDLVARKPVSPGYS